MKKGTAVPGVQASKHNRRRPHLTSALAFTAVSIVVVVLSSRQLATHDFHPHLHRSKEEDVALLFARAGALTTASRAGHRLKG